MEYIFSIPTPFERFVSIRQNIQGPFKNDAFELQLPAWRPGRYELGNFARNIRGFIAKNEKGTSLQVRKLTKDRWMISGKAKQVQIDYQYYAAQPDAGACYLDHELLYINPVHCCMFVPGREGEKCTVKLEVPKNWQVACGLPQKGKYTLVADNFDRLVDSPFMVSPSLVHAHYTLDGIRFNIWLYGNADPDWPKIIRDFEAFSEVQLKTMKLFPAKDFHFLVLLLPFHFYHGVEHLNSTVLALGPGHKLMQPEMYKELIGVASHELFHCWNVKSIRPVEMLPYDFTRENYSESGFVYEGVTTYYGDLFLARAGCFDIHDLLKEYSVRLQKHMDNPGRFNYSVTESSFDTWLDGYVPGVPGRKTSIYDEGCLLAWILDFMIRSATNSKRSLDDVMRALYFDYARKNKGYTAADFREVAEIVAGREFGDYFKNYVFKAASLDTLLSEVVSLAALSVTTTPAALLHESRLGMRTEIRAGQLFVSSTYPGSPAALAGLVKDDELIALNEIRIENNLNELLQMYPDASLKMLVNSGKKIREYILKSNKASWYNKYAIVSEGSVTRSQLNFRQKWLTI